MADETPHVVVVDDEPHLCVALGRILERGGYRVTTATDGETALRIIQEDPPEVILLDLMMPGLDGREVCRRLRDSGIDTRVIYFTARAEASDPVKVKELRSEADDFLVKPATGRQILSKVRKVMEGGSG